MAMAVSNQQDLTIAKKQQQKQQTTENQKKQQPDINQVNQKIW